MSKSGTRSANGMGSIRKRKDGTYEARYTGSDGKQHSVYAKTPKAIGEALRAATHSVDAGTWLEPSTLTVAQWLEIWLTDYCADTTERTVAKNRGMFARHFNPVLGAVKLLDLGDIHIQRILASLKRKGLAESTIKNYMAVFASALSQARRSKLIRDNPAAEIHLAGTPKKDFHIVDRQQLPAFFEAAKATRCPNELQFMILTGLRLGEVRGLRWVDVDLDAGTVNVRQQLRPKNKKMQRFTLPKYKKVRLLHIPPQVAEILKAQRKRQAEQRLAAGKAWVEDEISTGLVFRQKRGQAQGDATISRAVAAAGAVIGIPELHPHDLRHSYAVAALRAGADVKTVQYNLGHKTTQMTLDVYAAYTQDAGIAGAEKLSTYLNSLNI